MKIKMLVAVLLLSVLFFACGQKNGQNEETVKNSESEQETMPEKTYKTADLFDRIDGEETALSEYGLTRKKTVKQVRANFTPDEMKDVSISEEMLLFSFTVRADEPTELTVFIGCNSCDMTDKEGDYSIIYHVPTQWTRINMPICGEGVYGIMMSAKTPFDIAELITENHKGETYEKLSVKSGMWVIEDFEAVRVPEVQTGVGPTKDMVAAGDYIYSIGNGTLTVTDISDKENPKNAVRFRISGPASGRSRCWNRARRC